jgi:hypothetical protein
MKFLLIPSTITILIPALTDFLEYLKSQDQNAKKLAELTAQLAQSTTGVQAAVEEQS